MVEIIRGSSNKPGASMVLQDVFANNMELNGILYIGYPIIPTSEGGFPIDAIWLSEEKGIVVFCLDESGNLDDYKNIQDETYNKLFAKLFAQKELVDRRTPLLSINVVTFSPRAIINTSDEGYDICNESTLLEYLINVPNWEHSYLYKNLVAVIQSVSTIRKGRGKRNIKDINSKGAKLVRLEDSIANLDRNQGRAVIESVEGVQRIRGLAGSGKTIVLAMKAAYLHAQHPDWRIAVTFNTRSLKGQLKKWINKFYIEMTNDEPDWDNLKVIQAWGSNSSGGIYYDFCIKHGVSWYDYQNAKMQFGRNEEFKGVCRKALLEAKNFVDMYDAILIDEAQDFPLEFLRLCYEILSEPKRLVYAYDELQSLNLQSLPSPEEIFGNDSNGKPRVSFNYGEDGKSKQDIILGRCYRNSRPALITAHALGFGIYRKPDKTNSTGIVQMFEQNRLWFDIGYSVKEGYLEDGKEVVLERTDESSPRFLEEHSDFDDLVFCKKFETKHEENEWVAQQIINNINNEELNANDIIVINPNPYTTRDSVGEIRKILFDNGINSHLAGVDMSPDIFFDEDEESITFTGIYRAKGNEAAMVYIINSEEEINGSSNGEDTYNIAQTRNRLFTAITRSKAWVRILGVGPLMDELIKEVNKVKENDYTLDFRYPTLEERKKINIINRDMTASAKNKILKQRVAINELLKEIEREDIYLEDLGDDVVNKLKKILAEE